MRAGVGVVALGAAALIGGHALIEAGSALASGDPDAAARWFTLSFFAGAPLIVAYAAFKARMGRPAGAVVLVALIGIALQGVLAAGSYFTGDDWIHIVRAHDLVASGAALPDANYLGHVVFIHYAPGLRLGYWLLERFAPLDWATGLAGLLVLFAGSILLLHRILRTLYGERRSNLVLLLLFGTSILLVTSFLWFADGLHKLPSTFLSLLAVDAYLTYWRTRSKLALALSVVAVALGSLFYVKVLLVPMYLVLIRLLFLEERPRRAARILWNERWTWLAYAPPLALYLWNYLANYSHTRGPSPSLDLLGNYLWLNWFKGVTPALAGVEIGPQAARSGALFAVVAQLALIGVIALSVHLKRSAWRAWVFWGIAFSANAALVGLGRLGTMGLERVGQELRYDTEMSWLLPLALGFAFFPGKLAARPAPPLRARLPWTALPRVRTAGAVAVCAYLIAAVATGSGISNSWQEKNSGPPKAYVANVQDDVGSLVRGGRRPVAIDDQVPAFLIGSADHPLNRLEHLIPAIEPRLHVVVAGSRPLQVGDDGHVGLAQLQPLVSGDRALDGAGRVRVAGGRVSGRCLSGGGRLEFASKRLLTGQSLYALVSYDVERATARPGLIASPSPSRTGVIPLDDGRGHELVNLGRPVSVSMPRGSRACVRTLAVGWLGSNGR